MDFKPKDLESDTYHLIADTEDGVYVIRRKADGVCTPKYADSRIYYELRAIHAETRDGFDGYCASLFNRDGLTRTIKITVEGGAVQDVTGLPDGWDYEIDDKDGE